MKKIFYILIFILLAGGGIYVYYYLSNSNEYFDRGLNSLSNNRYKSARIAFKIVVEKYPYAPKAKEAEVFITQIDSILKRYLVYISIDQKRTKLVELQTKLSSKGINTEIHSTDLYPYLNDNSFVLILDRFENYNDAKNYSAAYNKKGVKVFLAQGY